MRASDLTSKPILFAFFSTVLVIAAMLLAPPSAKAADIKAEVQPAVIIDVRTPAEFAAGHIRGAINIPLNRLGEEIQAVPGIDKSSPILLYCRTGRRSEMARQVLIQQGYTEVVNGGGLEEMASRLPSCSYPMC